MHLLLRKVMKYGAVCCFFFFGGVHADTLAPMPFLGFSDLQPLLPFTGQLYSDSGVSIAQADFYRVRSGDTLYGISISYGKTLAQLATFNKLSKPYKLRVGQTLLLAPWGQSLGQGTQLQKLLQHLQEYPQQRFAQISVDGDDNLYRIGQMYTTNMQTLQQLNGLDENFTIFPKQKLTLPVVDYWHKGMADLPWQQEHLFYLAKEGQSVLAVAAELGLEEKHLQVIAPRVIWVNNLDVAVTKPMVADSAPVIESLEPSQQVSAFKVAAAVVKQAQALTAIPEIVTAAPIEDEALAPSPAVEIDVIEDITFSETDQLAAQDLLDAKQLVIGAPLQLDSLQPALDLLNQRYQQLGYKLSQAMVQQQQVVAGVIHIDLIEAKVGRVFVSEGAGLDADFVTEQMALNSGDNMHVGRLDDRLERFNRYHTGQARVALEAGKQYGESDVAISIVAPKNLRTSVGVNNYGAAATGTEQFVWNVDIWNLSGVDDQLMISSQDSAGVNSISAIYNRYIGTEGASLSFSGSVSTSNMINGPLSSLGVTGYGNSSAIELLYPMYMGQKFFLDGLLGYGQQYSETTYSGGAMSQHSEIQKYTLGYKLEYTGDSTVWTYMPKYQVYKLDNEDALGAPSKATGHKVVSDFELEHMLANNVSLGITNTIVHSVEKDINPLEQFSVGGLDSVRSFASSIHTGDSGAYLGAEIETSLGHALSLKDGNMLNNIQIYVFYDWAVAAPYRGSDDQLTPADYFSGFGFGVKRPSVDQGVSFDIFVGQPEKTNVHIDVLENDKPLVLGKMKLAF